MRAGTAIGLVFAAGILTSCAGAQPSGPQGIRFEGEGVRFSTPIGWHLQPTDAAVLGGGHWLVYLATQELHDQCGADPSGPCPAPLEELAVGGVLIGWYTVNCAGPQCTLPVGELTRVGAREAAFVTSRDSCGGIGQTEEADYLVAVSPQRIDTIVICGRETSEATRQTIRAFLDGVVWRTP